MRAIPPDIVAIARMAGSYSGRRTSRSRCYSPAPSMIVPPGPHEDRRAATIRWLVERRRIRAEQGQRERGFADWSETGTSKRH